MPKPVSPAAQMARGALFTYLGPRMAQDATPAQCMALVDRAVDGLNSKNFAARYQGVANGLLRSAQGRMAMDADIGDLLQLLAALGPSAESADQGNPAGAQIASNPGGSAPPPPAGLSVTTGSTDQPPGAQHPVDGILMMIKQYLEQEGVDPEIINNLDSIVAGPNGGNGNGNGPNGSGGDQFGATGSNLGGGGALPPGMSGDQISNLGAHAVPPGGGMDAEGTEGLTDQGDPGEAWRSMEVRGGSESVFVPESGETQGSDAAGGTGQDQPVPGEQDDTLPNDPPQRGDAAPGGEDQVPTEQSEQLGGVPVTQRYSGSVAGRASASGDRAPAQDNRPITKAAMDQAIKVAQDAAIRNQRAIRDAERFVRPWVGEIAMDANHPADVYRAALKALGVNGAEKLHPDALRPILEAQPRPSFRAAQQSTGRIAQDAAVQPEGSYLERFPMAGKITIMQ